MVGHMIDESESLEKRKTDYYDNMYIENMNLKRKNEVLEMALNDISKVVSKWKDKILKEV